MEPTTVSSLYSLKKSLAQLYNQINQEMYGVGVREQKIEILDNKIIIFGQHKRVHALSILSEKYNSMALSVDAALICEFKERLKSQIEKLLNLSVATILKDYDPVTETAFTVIWLEKS